MKNQSSHTRLTRSLPKFIRLWVILLLLLSVVATVNAAPAETPTITITGELNDFQSIPGVPSAPQSYTVAGSELPENIVITSPADFEISTSYIGVFSSQIQLIPIEKTVASTPIYVRLKRATLGTSSGNITHISIGAITVNVDVSGTVTTCADMSLVATVDTYLRADETDKNYGSVESIIVNKGMGDLRKTALLQWDLSAIPPSNVTNISSVSLTLNVINTTAFAYPMYAIKRNWGEGTSNWNTYDGTNTWEIPGAAGTNLDRGNINLWNATRTSFDQTGTKTVYLNSDGVGVVKQWVAVPSDNFGLIIQDYTGLVAAFVFSSSEAPVEANRPRLNINFCIPTAVTMNSFSAGKSSEGVPLAWETVSDDSTAGFDLYRQEASGSFVKVNDWLIPTQLVGQSMGGTYTYLDTGAVPGRRYIYRLEVIDTSLNVSSSTLLTYWPYAVMLPLLVR